MQSKILLGLGSIVLAGAVYAGATGAFFTSSANANGNTFTSGTLALKIAPDNSGVAGTYGDSLAPTWNLSKLAPGGTPVEQTLWLKNDGTLDGAHIGISALSSDATYASHFRITKLTLDGSNLLTGGAGASIGDYVAPTGCTVTVSGTKITDAINAATTLPGAIICVAPGSYTAAWEGVSSEIAVNKSVTIVSTQGPDVTTSIPFNVSVPNVTIRGFGITNPNGSYGVLVNGVSGAQVLDNKISNVGTSLTTGSAQGVFLAGGAGVTSFVAKNNVISNIGNTSLVTSSGGSSAKGVYIGDTAGTATLAGVEVSNNIISNIHASPAPFISGSAGYGGGAGAYGVLINYGKPTTTGKTNAPIVKNNSISNLDGLWSHAIGLEGPTPGAAVTYNDISNLVNHKSTNDSVGVQIEDNNGASILVNKNNLAPGVAYGVIEASTVGLALDATQNWWGDFTPANHVYSAGPSINTGSGENGPVAGVLPTGENGNGYADLADLNSYPITNAVPGFKTTQQRKLVIGVQLDGPSTGNEYQNTTLTTNFAFTLSQQ